MRREDEIREGNISGFCLKKFLSFWVKGTALFFSLDGVNKLRRWRMTGHIQRKRKIEGEKTNFFCGGCECSRILAEEIDRWSEEDMKKEKQLEDKGKIKWEGEWLPLVHQYCISRLGSWYIVEN